jgi:hypothetical protein
MDPTRPIDVLVRCESPHVVRYRLFVRPANENDFQKFAAGTNRGELDTHPIGPLPNGSEIGGSFNIVGNERTAYRVRFGCAQDGNVIPGASVAITGVTDDNGADSVDQRIQLP